jgi:hypothetical protein
LLPIITKREFASNTPFALSAAAFSMGSIISAILCVKIKVKHEGQTSILVWMIVIVAPLALAFPFSGTFIAPRFFIFSWGYRSCEFLGCAI